MSCSASFRGAAADRHGTIYTHVKVNGSNGGSSKVQRQLDAPLSMVAPWPAHGRCMLQLGGLCPQGWVVSSHRAGCVTALVGCSLMRHQPHYNGTAKPTLNCSTLMTSSHSNVQQSPSIK